MPGDGSTGWRLDDDSSPVPAGAGLELRHTSTDEAWFVIRSGSWLCIPCTWGRMTSGSRNCISGFCRQGR